MTIPGYTQLNSITPPVKGFQNGANNPESNKFHPILFDRHHYFLQLLQVPWLPHTRQRQNFPPVVSYGEYWPAGQRLPKVVVT